MVQEVQIAKPGPTSCPGYKFANGLSCLGMQLFPL